MTTSHLAVAVLLAASASPEEPFDAPAAAGRTAELLRRHYVARGRVEAAVEAVAGREALLQWRGLDAAAFARAATSALQAATGDRHLYLAGPRSGPAGAGDPGEAERRREREENFGFTACEVLPGNVGYLRITAFMEPQRSLETAVAALRFLRQTRALVIDLRGNGGGYAGLPEYLASYFFDPEPILLSTTHLREEGEAVEQTFSVPTLMGERRTGTPAFVLVDGRTASAAEWLAYTLQAFGKARVVGERSAGAANRNSFFELGHGLRLSVSTATPISAATGANWEATGVTPDVPCAPARALECALALARR